MKVYKMGPSGLNKCIEEDPKAIMFWLDEAEVGDKFEIEVLEMTREEYKSLPEYMGP